MNKSIILIGLIALIGLSVVESKKGPKSPKTTLPPRAYGESCISNKQCGLENSHLKCLNSVCACNTKEYQFEWNGSKCVLPYNAVCVDDSASASQSNEQDYCDSTKNLACNGQTCQCSTGAWDQAQSTCV